MYWSANLVSNLGVDDPLDAFAVHYGGGVVGVLATPVFMNGGIVDWTPCDDQEVAWKDAGSIGEFECSYTEFQGKDHKNAFTTYANIHANVFMIQKKSGHGILSVLLLSLFGLVVLPLCSFISST